MANIVTLFPPNLRPMNYENVTDVKADSDVITFYVPSESPAKKIVSSLPYLYAESVGS